MHKLDLTGVGTATGGVVGNGVGNGVGCKTDQKREEEMKRVRAVYLEVMMPVKDTLGLKSRDRLEISDNNRSLPRLLLEMV